MTEKQNNGGADPAPTKTALHREKLVQVVNNVSLMALDELRALREQIDALMIAINERKDTILHDVEEFASISQSALDTKTIIGDALGSLHTRFLESKIAPTMRGTAQKVMGPPVAAPPLPKLPDASEPLSAYAPKHSARRSPKMPGTTEDHEESPDLS